MRNYRKVGGSVRFYATSLVLIPPIPDFDFLARLEIMAAACL